MQKVKLYENVLNEDFKIIELWKAKNSTIVTFIEDLQRRLNIVINYMSGHIVKFDENNSPHFKEVVLRFVLNNEIVEAERIYFDDRQLFVRLTGDRRIRRISLKVIKEVQLNGQVFSLEKYKL